MAAAAIQFASLGMAGLFGYALFTGVLLVAKLVVIAAFLAYFAQLALTVMEDARLLGRTIPRFVTLVAHAAYVMAVVFCLVVVLVMLFA